MVGLIHVLEQFIQQDPASGAANGFSAKNHLQKILD